MQASLGAALAFVLVTTVSGCAASVAGATLVAVGGAGALAHECPSYVTVTLRDARTGRERCGEAIMAVSGERQRELVTCSTAPLPPGTWQLALARGNAVVGQSELVVEPPKACQRAVYSVELA